MLKSLGLWKTTAAVPAVKLADGEYTIENGQLKPVNASTPESSATTTRKGSDLQRLVEESEETADEVDVPTSDEKQPSVDGERKESNASVVSVTEIHPLSQPLQSVRLS